MGEAVSQNRQIHGPLPLALSQKLLLAFRSKGTPKQGLPRSWTPCPHPFHQGLAGICFVSRRDRFPFSYQHSLPLNPIVNLQLKVLIIWQGKQMCW